MTMTTGTRDANATIGELEAARERVWQLAFPAALETQFRAEGATKAATYIRRTLPWLTLMYLLVLGAIWFGVDDAAATLWRNQALLPAGLSMVALWIAVMIPRLDRHLSTIMGIAMLGALALMTRGVFLVDHVPLGRPVSYCVVYVLLIIFALSRLRLRQSLLMTAMALAIVLVSAEAEGLKPDWLAFAFYFPMTAILCAVVGYMIAGGLQSVFLMFAAVAAVAALITAAVAVETKGRVLEEVSP